MTPEMWITLAILVIALILFITEIIRLDLVALGVMAALMLTGILTVSEGLAGFSNPALISIGALFIVGGAVFHTGLAGMIAQRILQVAHGSIIRLLIILMVSIAVLSAFISSTGVVALMLPAIVSLSRSLRINPSKLLIPMAYAALMGGALTLIGTPPNLLVSDALRAAGFAPFDFFSFTPIGLLLLSAGVVYMVLIGRHILPDPPMDTSDVGVTTPSELFRLYELPGNLFRLRVQEGSPLIGRTIAESGLRSQYNLNVLSLSRAAHHHAPLVIPGRSRSDDDGRYHVATANTILHADDGLVIQGNPDDLGRALNDLRLTMVAAEPIVEEDVITHEQGIAEVLLRPRSTLIGKTIAEIAFATRYNLTVLNLRRTGVQESLPIKDTPLRFGDVMLVEGAWKDIFALKRLRQDFIVMGEREAIQLGAYTRPDKAPITLIVLIGMVIAVAFNILELAPASIIAALAVILTGCLNVDEAYSTIDLKTLFLMAGMLPMSTALTKVGLVDIFAGGLVDALGQQGPLLVQLGLFVLTVTITQVLSNTATAVLLAPLGIAAAQTLGVQPHALLMTVAIAASMAFATPLASPVNMLVISTGSYQFRDYIKVGVPLIVITLLISMILLPILWPF
ncbi:SLC13 family permease [Anaerolineae bacterium CFX9]|nr:SLC13 family permease [Anaerolineae bacterium CFX9]